MGRPPRARPARARTAWSTTCDGCAPGKAARVTSSGPQARAEARQVAHAATWASAMSSSSTVSSRSCWADKKDRAVGQSTGIGAARALSSLPTEASSAAQRSQARRCWPATRRSAWSSSPSAKADSVSKDRCAEIPTLPRRPKGPVCRLGPGARSMARRSGSTSPDRNRSRRFRFGRGAEDLGAERLVVA